MLFVHTNISQYLKSTFFAILIIVNTSLIGLLIFAIAPPKNPEISIPLSGEWKISLEDKPEFSSPDYNDSKWDSVKLPGNIIDYPFKIKAVVKGVCWLRKKVAIRDTHLPLGICLGRIAHADETFFNGEKIGGMGSFSPHIVSMWNHPRNYSLPNILVRKSEINTIAIRVAYYAIGDVSGKLMIVDMDYWDKYDKFSRFIHITMGYVSIAMGFTLFIFFSLLYARRPELDEYLYYILQLVFGLPIILYVCSYWEIIPSPIYRIKILGLSWVAINVVHPIFLHRIYHLERDLVEKLLWLYLGICLFIGIFLTPEPLMRFWGIILIVFTWPIGIYNFSVNITAIMNGYKYSKTYGFFGIVTVLCALNDGFIYFSQYTGIHLNFFGFQPSVMIFHIGAILLYMGTSLVLVTRFLNITEQIEALHTDLENFTVENSLLAEKLIEKNLPKEPAKVTHRAENKLKQAIDYINENYLSEMTRESIAETIDVHPDNLGKQFKQYTGKKLGDYIYELRVNHAAKMLRENDSNIIDIAFEAGFESLRTFNRVFPKFMEMTPIQYRKIHGKRKST